MHACESAKLHHFVLVPPFGKTAACTCHATARRNKGKVVGRSFVHAAGCCAGAGGSEERARRQRRSRSGDNAQQKCADEVGEGGDAPHTTARSILKPPCGGRGREAPSGLCLCMPSLWGGGAESALHVQEGQVHMCERAITASETFPFFCEGAAGQFHAAPPQKKGKV